MIRHPDDPLAAARGIALGIVIGLGIWLLVLVAGAVWLPD